MASSILIIRLDELGDMILTIPFLREWKKNSPQDSLTFLGPSHPSIQTLMRALPAIDTYLEAPPLLEGRCQRLRFFLIAAKLAKTLFSSQGVDVVLLPRAAPSDYRYFYLAYFSHAHRRIAFTSAIQGHLDFSLCITETLQIPQGLHCIEELDLLFRYIHGTKMADNRLSLPISSADREFATRMIGAIEGPYVAIGPGARTPQRRWPIERFATVIRRLGEKYPCSFFILGGEEDWEAGKQLEEVLPGRVYSFCGKTTICQAGTILERSSFYVGNDSALIHVAAAVGCPVVEITPHLWNKGWAGPARFYPWGVPSKVLSPPHPTPPCKGECEEKSPHCILSIEVDAVISACDRLGKDALIKSLT